MHDASAFNDRPRRSSILNAAGMEFLSSKYCYETPGTASDQFPFYDPSLGIMDEFVRDYYTTGLDGKAPDPSAREDLPIEWNFPKENLKRATFYNNTAHRLEHLPSLMRDWQRAGRQLCAIPLCPAMPHPFLAKYSSSWVEYVNHKALVYYPWVHTITATVMNHLYLSIIPKEYQTKNNLKLLYAISTAMEMATAGSLMVDDMVDFTLTRNGNPSWYLIHPVSVHNDGNILFDSARAILRNVVPRTHPHYQEMRDVMEDYIRHITYFFTYHTWQREESAAQARNGYRGSTAPLEDIDQSVFYAYTWRYQAIMATESSPTDR
jgi:hypothetical protein